MIAITPIASRDDREMDFEGTKLVISKHALDQFVQRWAAFENKPLVNPLQALKKIVRSAKAEEPHVIIKLLRQLTHGKPARYYVNGIWRFVIVTEREKATLVTAERKLEL